jgi:anti-sigma28 factor (negative regulator of flagellin synthesis)
MAALTSLATLAGTGATLYAQNRAQQQARATQRAQVEINQQGEQARMQQLGLQQQGENRERGEQLARTVASARARLAAGGLAVDDGSAASVTQGLAADAAAGAADSDALFRARLSSGRASLLNPDATLVNALRALPSFGGAVRSLLD